MLVFICSGDASRIAMNTVPTHDEADEWVCGMFSEWEGDVLCSHRFPDGNSSNVEKCLSDFCNLAASRLKASGRLVIDRPGEGFSVVAKDAEPALALIAEVLSHVLV